MNRTDNLALSKFMIGYMKQLLMNVPDSQFYDMPHRLNSPGWILGHVVMEGVEVLEKYSCTQSVEKEWWDMFHNTGTGITENSILPKKDNLELVFDEVYEKLHELYLSLSDEELSQPCESLMLSKVLSTRHAWFVHHLTTHIGIHSGNIVAWKKVVGIDVHGY